MKQEEKKLHEGVKEAAEEHVQSVVDAAGHPGWDWETRDITDAFIAGVEWGAEHLKGWRSVEESLPEMDEEVIVLKDKQNTGLVYEIAFGHLVDTERCIDYNGWNVPDVKFWMPMPKIPEEQK